MNDILQYCKVNGRKYLLGLVLGALVILELFTSAVESQNFPVKDQLLPQETVIRISDIDGPAIDSGAAMTSRAEEVETKEEHKISGEVWFSFLLLMSVLLAINFTLALIKKESLEWLPEVAYGALTLITWAVLDGCQASNWFPLVFLKVSLLMFAIYVYFFELKKREGGI